MVFTIKTPGTGSVTYSLNKQRVFPCPCGGVHMRREDHDRHVCLHLEDLVAASPEQVLCPLCGRSWRVASE